MGQYTTEGNGSASSTMNMRQQWSLSALAWRGCLMQSTSTTDTKSLWNQALADRAEHELDCSVCTIFSREPRCAEGQRLADADTALHAAWVRARNGEVSP